MKKHPLSVLKFNKRYITSLFTRALIKITQNEKKTLFICDSCNHDHYHSESDDF
jgi:rubrerythrin